MAVGRGNKRWDVFYNGVMEQRSLERRTIQLLQQIASYMADRHAEAYLVGGAVRDLLLHEPVPQDWDIVSEGDAHALARQLAEKLGGYYVRMHEKASRVVVKRDGQETVFDVAPRVGKTLEEDLRLRDFTLNAIAAPLASVVQHVTEGAQLRLVDPLQGASDLERRRLRVVDERAFQRDPLRLLRGVRCMQRYSLAPDGKTAGLMQRNAPLLAGVASERVHDEMYAVLQPTGATEWLHVLDEYGLLTVLMPECSPAKGVQQPGLHHWDVFNHMLQTVAALEQVTTLLQGRANEWKPRAETETVTQATHRDLAEIRALLNEAEQQGIFSYTQLAMPVLKLAALLHDIGKTVTQTCDQEGIIHFYNHPQAGVPLAQAILKRLGASTQDQRLVRQVVANHMRPGQLSRAVVTERAVRRFFVDLGPKGIDVALVSLADHVAMRGPEPLTDAWQRHLATVRFLLTRYIRERERILPPRLLQPQELMQHVNIPPGPLVGQLLEAIAEAQVEGRVQSKDEARWFVEERMRQ
ncbi:MAG: CCA tRNA nucleotidyltransferase [Ktedonobacteraceae bacterium]|nr:CCA tRNA nucleotidyltransferase [Ktedonobacteraceae bacterium]